MNQQLTPEFIIELYASMFRDVNILTLMKQHLKYTYLPNEAFKKVLQATLNVYQATSSLPTMGIIAQQHLNDADVLQLIAKIKEVGLINKQAQIDTFQVFVKKSMFVELYDEIGDLWVSGNHDKAIDILSKKASTISSFSIRDSYYDKLYAGFQGRIDKRQLYRSLGSQHSSLVPFSIDELDDACHGGMSETDTALIIAQSGVGKTKFLRWVAANAARRGFRVAHFSAEGSRDECVTGFDATWTALSKNALLYQDINPDIHKKLLSIINDITTSGGDVYIDAFEEFGSAQLSKIRSSLDEMFKMYGHIDLVTIDYLEKIQPISNYQYKPSEERERRKLLADQMKNIALEFKTRILTATQASTIEASQWNDPNFVMTRFNISEVKALVDPFSFVFTLNQTGDEYESRYMRIYGDKIRNYPAKQTIGIYQAYHFEKFYDRKKTINELSSVKLSNGKVSPIILAKLKNNEK